jgi:hypothetical protein
MLRIGGAVSNGHAVSRVFNRLNEVTSPRMACCTRVGAAVLFALVCATPAHAADVNGVSNWGALPTSLAARVQSGDMPFARAAQEAPPINCNASIRHHVTGVRIIHEEGGGLKVRKVYWTVRHTCTGAAALAFRGNPDLHRATGEYLLSYGDPYNDAFGSGPDGRIRLIERNWTYEPVPPRRALRVVWHSTITVPPPYQWVNDEPFGTQRGIDKTRSSCHRTTDGGYPAYLNVLKCKLVSRRFR